MSKTKSKRKPRSFKDLKVQSKIKIIKNKNFKKERVQKATFDLINSFFNEFIKTISIRAKENILSYGKKTLTYIDIYVAAMNICDDNNTYIQKLFEKGLKLKPNFNK